MTGPLVRAMFAPERRSVVLLLLALCIVLATSIDSPPLDSINTGFNFEYSTIAENRSPEHGFVGFRYRFLNGEGERAYELYNRFPIAGYLIIKAVILPFDGNPVAQLRAGRMLMLAFFAAAMLAMYFSLKRLTASPSIALAATLLASSSHYTLAMADVIATEGVMDLFAVMLTFHGLVVFVQQGRFAQLLAKACAAVLIGWHVFALLLPFIVFSLAVEWWRSRDGVLRRAGRLLRSRHVVLGAVVFAVGVSMLALNFGLEWAAQTRSERLAGAETTLAQLPSYQSMLRRTGRDSVFNTKYAITFAGGVEKGADYVGRVFTPYVVEGAARSVLGLHHLVPTSTWAALGEGSGERCGAVPAIAEAVEPWDAGAVERRSVVVTARRVAGFLVFVVAAVGIAYGRHRILLGTLATLGFCWAFLLAPGSGFFASYPEGMFFVGIPLVLYSLALMRVQRWSNRALHGCVGLAWLVFSLSALHPALSFGRLDAISEMASDKEAIHSVAAEGTVVIGCMRSAAVRYLLTGRILLSPLDDEQRHRADFVLADHVVGGAGLLTPDNRFYFLYERAAYDAKYAAQPHPTSK